jgi:hypothetical protein
LLLRTAFNSDEVKKALASCVDQRDEFRKLGHKPSNVAPGDDAGDVVCELNVAKSGHGHGVDVIKLLRSRQVLHMFSARLARHHHGDHSTALSATSIHVASPRS